MNTDLKSLHPLEIQVLLLPVAPLTVERVVEDLHFNIGQCNQAFSWLNSKGYIEEKERSVTLEYELTDLGKACQKTGMPEERILSLLSTDRKSVV